MRIMIVEDDKTISFAIAKFLEKYGIESKIFEDFNSLRDIDIDDFDMTILDVNLPDGSGFDYLK